MVWQLLKEEGWNIFVKMWSFLWCVLLKIYIKGSNLFMFSNSGMVKRWLVGSVQETCQASRKFQGRVALQNYHLPRWTMIAWTSIHSPWRVALYNNKINLKIPHLIIYFLQTVFHFIGLEIQVNGMPKLHKQLHCLSLLSSPPFRWGW